MTLGDKTGKFFEAKKSALNEKQKKLKKSALNETTPFPGTQKQGFRYFGCQKQVNVS